MSDKIQKRLVTFEVITRGDVPVELNAITQDALIEGFHSVVAKEVDLRYKNYHGENRRHDFVGIAIKEIK